MNFCKKILLSVAAALSLANAAEGFTSKTGVSPVSTFLTPTFYEEQIIRQRDWAAQNPVTLETPIDSNYIIGPGDFFEIILPNSSEGIQVSPEGTVAIQGYGLLEVSGLKLSEAKQRILEKLRTRYDKKFTGVHLVQLRRFAVNVQGAVWRPGQVVVSGQARAKEAIYSAGNFKSYANKDSIYVYRKGDTIATTENILLQIGDIIEVPHREWQQSVDFTYAGKTITVPYVPKQTIKEYLRDAGIYMEQKYSQVSVKYPEDSYTRWISIDQIDHFFPEPLNEIEFHIQAPFVYVGGAVAAVGKVPYNSSMHPADYVAASGVTIITGDLSRISVMRNGKWISMDWATGEILPGDFIEIPRTAYEVVKDVTLFITSLLSVFATLIIIASY
ncbi:MAG: polysaccharide biosynthesis/export family protein [Candidatus Fibromonas sp.]|jgi:protein involved in polysaccharide export with SLBB domain|nr:polysaccharide biosynthesis/export family protein [Candidatus Fibromonas sp.]